MESIRIHGAGDYEQRVIIRGVSHSEDLRANVEAAFYEYTAYKLDKLRFESEVI